MKRVITYGTFDLLHYGHINLLRRAKALGDYLIVVLSTDEFNWEQKQKKCYFTYEQRKQLLEAIRYVDLVIPEENWEQKRTDVHEYHIDTFVMGDDWKGKFDFLKEEGVEVSAASEINAALLNQPEEIALIKALSQLPEEIHLAARDYDPSHINRYLMELAACFHKFYSACRIKGEESAVLAARLKLADTTRSVLKNGLALLGVDAPEKM